MTDDIRSATQKILDAGLQQRREKSNASLNDVLENKRTWDDARRPVIEAASLVLEFDQLNHAGIQDLKNELGNVTGSIDTLTKVVEDNVATTMVIDRGPLKGLPVKYVFCGGIIALGFATIVIMFALAHGKLTELAEGINIVRGKAHIETTANSATSSGGVARRIP